VAGIAAPFNSSCEVGKKPDPVAVNVALAAVMVDGDTLVRVGTGLRSEIVVLAVLPFN